MRSNWFSTKALCATFGVMIGGGANSLIGFMVSKLASFARSSYEKTARLKIGLIKTPFKI